MNIDVNLIRFSHYIHTQTATKAARAQAEASQARLEIASIEERDAELSSQSFASVARGRLFETLGKITDREREIGIAFARYAVYGRTDKA